MFPVIAIVLILCLSIAPVSPGILMAFLIGAALLTAGMVLFTMGVDMAMTPMGELAIVLDMPIQGADEKEQFAILTKSFEEFIGLKNSAYVDINNCPFAPQLLNRGFAKDTGLYKESGFCSYPLWTFDETVLKETGGEKYERYARAYDEYMESSFIGMMGAEDETGEEICTGMMM